MKPELAAFFRQMNGYFGHAQDADSLKAAFPGWEAATGRVQIYGRFVDGHVRTTLEKLYPVVREVLGEERWSELARGYDALRPATHFEMNQLGAAFPSFLADRAQGEGLPAFLPALARFEWLDFEVYASPERLPAQVERLMPNPTTAVLQHDFRLVPWVRAKPQRPPSPEEGAETVLMWRHPQTLRTTYLAADERALLVLKMAIEGLLPSEVAAASGLSVQAISDLTQLYARDGLVLAPK